MRFSSLFSGLVTILTAGNVMAGPPPPPSPPGPQAGPGPLAGPAAPPTILLIHGAWHNTPTFDLLRAQLSQRGFSSTAVKLVTAGPTDAKNQGIAQDVVVIQSELDGLVNTGKEVVVVCHSYGGIPTAAAVEGRNLKDRAAQGQKGGVRMVVYMTSFALPKGVSLMDGLGGKPADFFNVTGDVILPIDPANRFYADVEPALSAKAVSQILPQSLKAFEDKAIFEPWAAGFEMGYIFAEDDQAIPIDVQKQMQSAFPSGSFTASLKSSHSPFLSMPARVAELLQQAVDQSAKKPGRP
ncbi:hypothetical protein PG990_008502 [Apiospora arundinis]